MSVVEQLPYATVDQALEAARADNLITFRMAYEPGMVTQLQRPHLAVRAEPPRAYQLVHRWTARAPGYCWIPMRQTEASR